MSNVEKTKDESIDQENAAKVLSAISSVLLLISRLFKQIGFTKGLVSILLTIFLVWGSSEQKQNFIDTYILFNNWETNPVPVVLVSAIILVFLIKVVYFRKHLKEKNIQIDALKVEIDELQQINLDLRSKKKEAKNKK